MWVPVEDQSGSERAFKALRSNFIKGAEPFRDHLLGWQGGSERRDVFWHRSSGLWAMMMKSPRGTPRYWCAFGTADPQLHSNLDIDVEINPPLRGIDRRLAGAFVRDRTGRVHFAHSGRLGGGHRGIGKSAFHVFYRGNWQEVTWPDRTSSAMVVLGAVDNPRLAASIAEFVREVARFKREVRNGRSPGLSGSVPHIGFGPEFVGKRRRYDLRGEIDAECWHGAVVSRLADALANRRLIANDRYRDLIVMAEGGTVTHLFEVKTDIDTTSLYCGIGQLMMHAARDRNEQPRKILVLPKRPSDSVLGTIERLGIELMYYRWVGNRPVFDGLDAVL